MIRTTKFDDFSEILKIQDDSYDPEFVEGLDILLKHFKRYPKGCLVLEFKEKIVGFVISFPLLRGIASESLEEFPEIDKCDCFYIHDFVIHPNFQGQGFSKILLKKVLEISEYPVISLASVPEQSGFWSKNGFKITKEMNLDRSKVIMMELEL